MSFYRPFLMPGNVEIKRENNEKIGHLILETAKPTSHQSILVGTTNEKKQVNSTSFSNVNLIKKRREAEVLNHLENRTVHRETDEIDCIFMGYAKTVKKFSSKRQTLVKFRIAKLLMEEELQQHAENEAGMDCS